MITCDGVQIQLFVGPSAKEEAPVAEQMDRSWVIVQLFVASMGLKSSHYFHFYIVNQMALFVAEKAHGLCPIGDYQNFTCNAPTEEQKVNLF